MEQTGAEQERLQSILVVRTDRIGDVLLTLPAVEALSKQYPDARISMLVSDYSSDLVEGKANILLYSLHQQYIPFFEMRKKIRENHFDAALVAYPRFRIAFLLWCAGIPLRIGSGYRWYSFLFNRRIYEHRKTAEKHEAEYNYSLARALGCPLPEKLESRLNLTQREKQKAQEIRLTLGLRANDSVILIHPGSGGSARNWKPERFSELARELTNQGMTVVFTGTKPEETLIHAIAGNARCPVKTFISTIRLREFAAFIQTADLFIANSTGPLHIAASVGTPVIGFYPPVPAMSSKRWGPLTEAKILFVPDPQQCPRCKGGPCRGYECMDQITVQQVCNASMTLLKKLKENI